MDWSADGLMAFATAHQPMAWGVVLVMSVLETTPVISAFVPTMPVLIGLGVLASAGTISFLPIFLGAWAGAVIGSSFAWWLGHHFGRAILRWKPIETHPDWVRKGTDGINRYGPWVILFSHIFAPLTAAVFLIAGVTRMPFWRFQLANVPGALAWAWLVPKTGEWGSELLERLWALVA
ncbi:MAG: DedA family protein [Candidatus Saccharibacteria bacterium]|nr:DedA family protein [Pseudorhodobacter sp.]